VSTPNLNIKTIQTISVACTSMANITRTSSAIITL
jgi:hypothetical protein